MTQRQIELLKMTIDGVHYYNDVTGTDRGVLMYLEQNGLSYTKQYSHTYLITEKGRAVLEELEEKAKEQAENKRQRRFEKKIAILNVLIPFVTFIAGIFIEYFSGIVDWFVRFFQ